MIIGPERILPEIQIPPPNSHSMVSLGYTLGIWVEILLLKFPTSLTFMEQKKRVGFRFCPYYFCDIGQVTSSVWAQESPVAQGCPPPSVTAIVGVLGARDWGQEAFGVPAPAFEQWNGDSPSASLVGPE